jgi:hypothetical protein
MQQQEEKEIIRPTNKNITNREMMMLLHSFASSSSNFHASFPHASNP